MTATVRLLGPTLKPRKVPFECEEVPEEMRSYSPNIVAIYRKGCSGEINEYNCFFVDREDFEKIKPYRWRRNSHGYMMADMYFECSKGTDTVIVRRPVYLHHFVMGLYTNWFLKTCVDHIDARKTNNCKYNLRYISTKANAAHAVFLRKIRNRKERSRVVAAIQVLHNEPKVYAPT